MSAIFSYAIRLAYLSGANPVCEVGPRERAATLSATHIRWMTLNC
jgi:hypothetical protein